MCDILVERKSMYLRAFESENHKNDWDRKSQIRKVIHLRMVAKQTNYQSPQICGFAELICGPPTYDFFVVSRDSSLEVHYYMKNLSVNLSAGASRRSPPPLRLGFGMEFRSKKIPRNRLGTVSVILRKKVLITRHSEFAEEPIPKLGTERTGDPRKKFYGTV